MDTLENVNRKRPGEGARYRKGVRYEVLGVSGSGLCRPAAGTAYKSVQVLGSDKPIPADPLGRDPAPRTMAPDHAHVEPEPPRGLGNGEQILGLGSWVLGLGSWHFSVLRTQYIYCRGCGIGIQLSIEHCCLKIFKAQGSRLNPMPSRNAPRRARQRGFCCYFWQVCRFAGENMVHFWSRCANFLCNLFLGSSTFQPQVKYPLFLPHGRVTRADRLAGVAATSWGCTFWSIDSQAVVDLPAAAAV